MGKERAVELLLGCLAGLCGAGAGAGRAETERESWTERERPGWAAELDQSMRLGYGDKGKAGLAWSLG